MGMSAGGSEALFKLAENAAPEEGRLMPTERKYAKSSKTISITEAISLMQQRKANPALRIKGGLDDTSDSVRRNAKSTGREAMARSEGEGAGEGEGAKPVELPVAFPWPAATLPLPPPADQPQRGPEPGEHGKRRATTADIMKGLDVVQRQILSLRDGIVSSTRTLQAALAPQTKAADSEKTPAVIDALAEFKSETHMVTFLLNSMEFTVKCLNMVKDDSAHTLVLAFASDGDSFFTPPMQSELSIRYDGTALPGKLYYFGMMFSLPALGLRFLGFLYDEVKSDAQ